MGATAIETAVEKGTETRIGTAWNLARNDADHSSREPGRKSTAREESDDMKISDETLDTLFRGKVRVYQSRSGYRFSLDAVLLAHFVTFRPGEKVADLGTGNGVIPVLLAYLNSSVFITGVEIQQAMVARARKNVQLNSFEKRVRILSGDVCSIESMAEPQSYDVVVSNLPYRKPSSGRLSPNTEKQIARHEVKAELQDFLRAGTYLMRGKGRIALIYPAVRSVDLLVSMREVGVEPKRLRLVYSFAGAEAALVLVEGVKGGRGGIKALSPLVIYEQGKRYSMEVKAMLAGSTESVSR